MPVLDTPNVAVPRPRTSRDSRRAATAIRVAAWAVLAALGALQAWTYRHAMNPDGVSYLDVADAYARGGWQAGINGYWSPLYSWVLMAALRVLHPSPAAEFAAVHGVNFALYLLALGGFELFLRELLRARRRAHGDGLALEWAVVAAGYLAFAWECLRLVTLSVVTPDLMVAALTFACAALLLRAERDGGRAITLVLLGAAAGLAYLAKAAMFPVGFVTIATLGVIVARRRGWRAGARRAAVALAVFLLICAPFVVSLSLAKHRPTFGEVGRLAYAWYVDGLPRMGRWQGGGGTGTPVHAPRVIYGSPRVYSYASPLPATYPVWYDASYWYEGMRVPVRAGAQAWAIARNLHLLYGRFLLFLPAILLAVLAARGLVTARAGIWLATVPSLAALAMYTVVFVDARFIAAQLCIILLAYLASPAPGTGGDRRVLAVVFALAMLPILIGLVRTGRPLAADAARGGPPNTAWMQARALHAAGVPEGARVGFIGDGPRAYWARVARVRIVAETWDVRGFWSAPPAVQQAVLAAMRREGATAVVATNPAPCPAEGGWRALAPGMCVFTP